MRKKKSNKLLKYKKFFIVFSFISVLSIILYNLYKIRHDIIIFERHEIIIDGCQNITPKEIIDSQKLLTIKCLLQYDLNTIQNELKENPWINSVIIQRKLPHTLYIRISERKPIAIWQFNNQYYLIDENGFKISTDIIGFESLPITIGQDANIKANEIINIINQYPTIKKEIKYMQYVGQRRFDLIFQDGLIAKCQENDIIKSLNTLQELKQKNTKLAQTYSEIDLRFDDRIILTKIIQQKNKIKSKTKK